jgi:hypothetical protein
MARFRLSGNLRIETGRHEGLPRNERSCHRCKRLLDEDFVAPIDDQEHFLFSWEITKDIRLRFAGLPMSSLRDVMQCEDVGSVAWFVHECMEKGRQQSCWLSRGQQCYNVMRAYRHLPAVK